MTPVPGGMKIEYEGALVTSTNLQSWQVVNPQPASPAFIPTDDAARFYRAATE